MVLGFNHNIMYRGEVFHVQTEDSGVDIPNIVTLLYQGGVIHCSIKTSYSDIVKMDNLEQVVEELMKEQHKQMMRRLKSGELDERIFPGEKPSDAGDMARDEDAPDNAVAASALQRVAPEADVSPAETTANLEIVEVMPDEEGAAQKCESLDDAVLSFFNVADV
jgi:hypothetical protein